MISVSKVVLAVALVCLAAGSESLQIPHVQTGEHSLMEFLMQSNLKARSNPAVSMACFGYYVPVLNQIASDYEKNYGSCLNKAEAQKADVDAQKQPERQQIQEAAQSACQLLESCNELTSSIEYFECYVKGGTDNSKTMYTISNDAKDALENVREEYRLIENQLGRCTGDAERQYLEDTAKTYDDLQSCLDEKTPVPQPTTAAPPQTTADDTTVTVEMSEGAEF